MEIIEALHVGHVQLHQYRLWLDLHSILGLAFRVLDSFVNCFFRSQAGVYTELEGAHEANLGGAAAGAGMACSLGRR